jgi:MOSC domain-containing protein YiiM
MDADQTALMSVEARSTAVVVAVCSKNAHAFSKDSRLSIRLLAGLGVEGDAHCGARVKHRSRVAKDPTQPNLRQVHLLHAELFDELSANGFAIRPSDMGENITTRGIDLLSLPRGTQLRIGATAIVEVTGLRNPCAQIERFRSGLLEAVVERNAQGRLIRKAGVMGVVVQSGDVKMGDAIAVELPSHPHEALQPV